MSSSIPKAQAIIMSNAILEYYIKDTYRSPLLGLPLTASKLTERQIEQLSHFAKQGVKVRLK